MNWLTELLTIRGYRYQTKFLSRVLGVAILCCSSFGFADSLDKTLEPDDLAWIDNHTAAIEDVDLSFINGKGAEESTLNDGGKLAIILWDERGGSNRRGTNHDVDVRPAINLTVIQK